ncbi:MAG: hypothetical protein ACKO37_08860 [Vampirovibrionales bacterium]
MTYSVYHIHTFKPYASLRLLVAFMVIWAGIQLVVQELVVWLPYLLQYRLGYILLAPQSLWGLPCITVVLMLLLYHFGVKHPTPRYTMPSSQYLWVHWFFARMVFFLGVFAILACASFAWIDVLSTLKECLMTLHKTLRVGDIIEWFPIEKVHYCTSALLNFYVQVSSLPQAFQIFIRQYGTLLVILHWLNFIKTAKAPQLEVHDNVWLKRWCIDTARWLLWGVVCVVLWGVLGGLPHAYPEYRTGLLVFNRVFGMICLMVTHPWQPTKRLRLRPFLKALYQPTRVAYNTPFPVELIPNKPSYTELMNTMVESTLVQKINTCATILYQSHYWWLYTQLTSLLFGSLAIYHLSLQVGYHSHYPGSKGPIILYLMALIYLPIGPFLPEYMVKKIHTHFKLHKPLAIQNYGVTVFHLYTFIFYSGLLAIGCLELPRFLELLAIFCKEVSQNTVRLPHFSPSDFTKHPIITSFSACFMSLALFLLFLVRDRFALIGHANTLEYSDTYESPPKLLPL